MYNGIGLSSARGSATNGYVVKNLSLLKKTKRQEQEYVNLKNENITSLEREPNLEIMEHEIKREVEIKCMDLRIKLEDEGLEDNDIDTEVQILRDKLNKRVREEDLNYEKQKKIKISETHKLNHAKNTKNDRMMDALGLKKEGYQPGKVFENMGNNSKQDEQPKILKQVPVTSNKKNSISSSDDSGSSTVDSDSSSD